MREMLFRGKRKDNGEWVEGDGIHYPKSFNYKGTCWIDGMHNRANAWVQVIPETVGQYTGLPDKNGKKIFESDIVQYLTFDGFDCQSVVKFGEYKQDGSDGEYSQTECVGFYVEVNNFTCPDWCENEPEYFKDYLRQQNILEVASMCEVIGNIYDNPELLKGA